MTTELKEQLLRIIAFALTKQSIRDREEQRQRGINPDGYREIYEAVEKIKPRHGGANGADKQGRA